MGGWELSDDVTSIHPRSGAVRYGWPGTRGRSMTQSGLPSRRSPKIRCSKQTLRHRIRQLERDAAPVVAAKHGRPVVIVLSVKEYEHLKALESAGKS